MPPPEWGDATAACGVWSIQREADMADVKCNRQVAYKPGRRRWSAQFVYDRDRVTGSRRDPITADMADLVDATPTGAAVCCSAPTPAPCLCSVPPSLAGAHGHTATAMTRPALLLSASLVVLPLDARAPRRRQRSCHRHHRQHRAGLIASKASRISYRAGWSSPVRSPPGPVRAWWQHWGQPSSPPFPLRAWCPVYGPWRGVQRGLGSNGTENLCSGGRVTFRGACRAT